MAGLDFISTLAAVLVIPTVIFSFWKISKRSEFAPLRESGQKLNLNLHNLLYGFKREKGDPLRIIHIKLAKIGLLHWLFIPIGFFLVLVTTMLIILVTGNH